MDVKDFLAPADVVADLRIDDKVELLRELARRAAEGLGLEADGIAQGLLNREQLGSTGTGGGIAMPHARIEGLEKPLGIFARLKKPIAFDAIDQKPVDLVFMLLLPATAEGDQLNALASVARTLRNPAIAGNLRRALTDSDLYHAMVDARTD